MHQVLMSSCATPTISILAERADTANVNGERPAKALTAVRDHG
jgi:hypothetical protein